MLAQDKNSGLRVPHLRLIDSLKSSNAHMRTLAWANTFDVWTGGLTIFLRKTTVGKLLSSES